MAKIIIGVAIVFGLMAWNARGALQLMRILDNPRDARNMRDRKPQGFKWSDEE